VSTDPAPDSALPHPSSLDQPASYRDPIVQCLLGLVRLKCSINPDRAGEPRWPGDADADWKTRPFVSAFIGAVDDAIRAHQPHHGMSAIQRTWLAFCVTAVLVTDSICWARFARASLGAYSLAALSWMFRHSKIPWDSKNSSPPLIVTTTSLGRLSSRSKRMCILQMYIELWHELLRAISLALTPYNIYIYRHESP
jgi:hypothetical protein